jgi:DNA-directed RNA polymerase subunit RPC12/RpoP
MTQEKEILKRIEVSNYESRCSLCGHRIMVNLDTERSKKRTNAEQRRKHESLFWEHVQLAHPEVYVSVEKIEVNPDSAEPENAAGSGPRLESD